MRKRIIVGAVIGVVIVACAGLGYASTQPPSFHDYRKTAVQAAEAAHDALRTASLAVRALSQHRVTSPYVSVVLDECLTSVSGAGSQLDQLPPPDGPTAAMRDELVPLVGEAAHRLGDVSSAAGDSHATKLSDAAAALDPLADRLADFLHRHG